MLCFDFFGDRGVDVLLCEETIRYNPVREEGLYLAATVVVRMGSHDHRVLQMIHPRSLTNLELSSSQSWLEPEDGFPYGHVFCNIARNRMVQQTDGRGWLLRTFQEQDGKMTLAEDSRVEVRMIGSESIGVNGLGADDETAPYTCIDVGPFPETGDCMYVFRIHCRLIGASYDDLVDEDAPTGTRLYKIYGGEYLYESIRSVFLPKCVRTLPEGSGEYAEKFALLTEDRRLVPWAYSVVAVDHPNCRPARMATLDLTDDLWTVSHAIDPSVYTHECISALDNRMHWFVTRSKSFFLQLLGPAAAPVGAG